MSVFQFISVPYAFSGFAVGFVVGMTGVGGGSLMTPLPIVRIVGTDIAHAVPLTLVAGLGHLVMGAVDLALLASLLIGSLPGIAFGSLVAPRVPERILRLLLAVVLAVGGMRLVWR